MPALIEAVLALAAVAVLGGYHLWLWRRTRLRPATVATGRHRIARAAWLRAMHDTGNQLLVVQTLRNWIMAATFLASASMLFALGMLGAAFTTNSLSTAAHALNFLGSQDQQLWLFKALLLIVDFLAGFFSFSLAIRSFIHAGFAVDVPAEPGQPSPYEANRRELERGALHYTLGMRAFYLAIPLALWLFGPLWMLCGAIGLVAILGRVD